MANLESAYIASVDLNCDVGEFDERDSRNVDASLFSFVTSASIACGAHAGDVHTMSRSVALAAAHHVTIGAHVGYPDRQGFGRRRMDVPANQLQSLLVAQLETLQTICDAHERVMRYVKPHGALYHAAAEESGIAEAVINAILQHNRELFVVGMLRTYLQRSAVAVGMTFIPEGFPDRRYTVDGRLESRSRPHAVLTDPASVAFHALHLVACERYSSDHSGSPEPSLRRVRTLCLHGDSPGAHENAKAIRSLFRGARVVIEPFAEA